MRVFGAKATVASVSSFLGFSGVSSFYSEGQPVHSQAVIATLAKEGYVQLLSIAAQTAPQVSVVIDGVDHKVDCTLPIAKVFSRTEKLSQM